eukprot:6490419-Amphidinium_carterae.9
MGSPCLELQQHHHSLTMVPNFPLPLLVSERIVTGSSSSSWLRMQLYVHLDSRDQQALETAQGISMAHASGATAAQISAAAEAEIRRTREQSESVLLQQQQGFHTDAHHALEQQAALHQQHQQNACQAIQSEADRMRGELSTTLALQFQQQVPTTTVVVPLRPPPVIQHVHGSRSALPNITSSSLCNWKSESCDKHNPIDVISHNSLIRETLPAANAVSLHRALPCYSPELPVPEVSCRQAHVEPTQMRLVNTTPSVDRAHGHPRRDSLHHPHADIDHDMEVNNSASAWTFNQPHGDMASTPNVGSAPGFRIPGAHSGLRRPASSYMGDSRPEDKTLNKSLAEFFGVTFMDRQDSVMLHGVMLLFSNDPFIPPT